jgi:flagellar protein FliO/FliZ
MEISQYLQFAAALLVVLALMGLLAFALKKLNIAQSGMHGKGNRIKIMEQRMIDSRHKVAIIRCDDKDHLVILGQNSNTVIKADMEVQSSSES